MAHVQHRPPDAQVRKSDHWEEGEEYENWSATEAWLSFAEKDVLTKLQNYSAVGNSQWFLIAKDHRKSELHGDHIQIHASSSHQGWIYWTLVQLKFRKKTCKSKGECT